MLAKCERILTMLQHGSKGYIVRSDVKAELSCSGDVANAVIHRLENDKKIAAREPVRVGNVPTEAWTKAGDLPLE